MSDEITIRVIPVSEPTPWPIEARTLEEAYAILRRPGRWLTREEMEFIYPSTNAENS